MTYNNGWAGAYLHSDAPAGGYLSLRVKTDRAIKLLVSCFNNVDGAKARNFAIETQVGIEASVPLSSCGDGKAFKDLMLQNGTPGAQAKVTFQTLELVGADTASGFLTDAQGQIRDYLETAAKWGKANKRPVFMGEFGAFEKGDMASRVRWTKFTREEAERRRISWAYWEFNGNFGVWNPKTKVWRDDLRKSLVGK